MVEIYCDLRVYYVFWGRAFTMTKTARLPFAACSVTAPFPSSGVQNDQQVGPVFIYAFSAKMRAKKQGAGRSYLQ